MEIKFAPLQIARNNTMSYSSIHEKLKNKKTIILDGGLGAELEKNGAKMDEKMWCGKCSVDHPELVRKIHEDYINAGADVITTNTYSTTPISMRQYGYEDSIEEFNKKSVQVAKDAIKNSNKDVALAGSVSTFGNFYKLGVKAMIPGFDEQLKILSGEGVDLIILEAMSSQADIVETMLNCSTKISIPVWLSVSCVTNDQNQIMLGYNDTIDSDTHVYENFEKSINNFKKIHNGPILVAHSDIKTTGKAIKTARENFDGALGAYPNKGYYEKPHWRFIDDMTPNDYLNEVKTWIKDGAQIIGGCCGIGVDEIKAISILKN